MSDTAEFGSFTDAGEYIPRTVVENDLGATSFAEAIDGTIVEFEDGDLVSGTVVRIDRFGFPILPRMHAPNRQWF